MFFFVFFFYMTYVTAVCPVRRETRVPLTVSHTCTLPSSEPPTTTWSLAPKQHEIKFFVVLRWPRYLKQDKILSLYILFFIIHFFHYTFCFSLYIWFFIIQRRWPRYLKWIYFLKKGEWDGTKQRDVYTR
jgi:hypothetical protein